MLDLRNANDEYWNANEFADSDEPDEMVCADGYGPTYREFATHLFRIGHPECFRCGAPNED